MGLSERFAAWRERPAKRPKGGAKGATLYVPPEPQPAPGAAPPSPAEAVATAGAAPPRPLVWVGTSASGAAVWSSPLGNGVGLDVWRDLHAVAGSAGAYPVLTGPTPLPSSWHLDAAEPAPSGTGDAGALLDAATAALPVPPDGLRTRLEPGDEASVEPALAAGYLALVTGVDGADVPAAVGLTGLGGWTAAEHSAVLGWFAQRYGADLVALTADGLALVVRRPPRSHEDAFATARELYAYCPDVILHGTRTMWGLATTMAVSRAWVLRWSP